MRSRTNLFQPKRRIISSAVGSQICLHIFSHLCSFQWVWSSLCYCWVRLNSSAAASFTKLPSFLWLVYQSLGPKQNNSAGSAKPVSIQSALKNPTKIWGFSDSNLKLETTYKAGSSTQTNSHYRNNCRKAYVIAFALILQIKQYDIYTFTSGPHQAFIFFPFF